VIRVYDEAGNVRRTSTQDSSESSEFTFITPKTMSLMANFVDSSFEGQTIVLDDNDYLRCRFLRCRIIVTRGNFSVRECTFDTCNFEFSGEAENIRTLVLTLRNQRPTATGN
jgi:hypothetical protein